MNVRRLARDELPLAVPLLEPEGWTLTQHELGRLHSLGGAVGAFDGERMIGFLTYLDTPPYRWIGNVAVDAAARGRGVGAAVVSEAMRDADRVALYSVEKAVTLYARLGLVPQGDIRALRAMHALPGDGEAEPLREEDVPGVLALDRAATGMERERLLRALIDAYPARVVRRSGRIVGFALAKTYSDVTEIGPVLGETPADAWAAVDELLHATPPPHDAAVLGLPDPGWRERGFAPLFRAIAMFRGGGPAWDRDRYLATSGLEKG